MKSVFADEDLFQEAALRLGQEKSNLRSK